MPEGLLGQIAPLGKKGLHELPPYLKDMFRKILFF
jgi:hypothetical protein